jgi:CMP/dCMP kinase
MIATAIDGPAGAGKSSVAKAVAAKTGFIYVDTGALYRTVALHLLNNGISAEEVEKVEASLPNIEVSLSHEEDGQHVYLCGEDVSSKIRTPEVSMMASKSSAIPAVRKFLFSLQTGMAEKYNVIMDGRDIGTVVLPNAQVKVFLTASPEERAKRRYNEYIAKGENADYDEILRDVIQRDYQDTHREIAPLKAADDAVVVDSTEMSFDEVVAKISEIIDSKISA